MKTTGAIQISKKLLLTAFVAVTALSASSHAGLSCKLVFKEAVGAERIAVKLAEIAQDPNQIRASLPYPALESGFRVAAEYEPLIASGRLQTLDSMKIALRELDPIAAEIADQLVVPENLVVYMMRHQTPAEIKKQKGEFIKASESDHTLIRTGVIDSMAALYGEKAPPEMYPNHSFLWFKNIPKNVVLQFPYSSLDTSYERTRVVTYFGYNIYKFDYKTIAAKASLISIGDFLATRITNLLDLSAKGKIAPEDKFDFDQGFLSRFSSGKRTQREILGSEKYDLVTSQSYYDVHDLRGVYMNVFDSIHLSRVYNKVKRFTEKKPVIIEMPGGASFEVVIFDRLYLKDAEPFDPKIAPNGFPGTREIIEE